jgi:hypothetical protein
MIMVFNGYQGFSELMSVLILTCGNMKMHFAFLMFYEVLAIFSFVYYFSNVGLAA